MTVQQAISKLAPSELNRPTVSTIPMLDLMIHHEDQFQEIIEELGMGKPDCLTLEYTAGPFAGRGTASHTDVMLQNAEQSLAIEAKWTESMYETVENWLTGAKGENKSKVLQGWFTQLRHYSFPVDYQKLIYQMVHRAASAAEAGASPGMAYFLFEVEGFSSGASQDAIQYELKRLRTFLPASFRLHTVKVHLEPAKAYETIRGLEPGDKKTSESIVSRLQRKAKLFTLKHYNVTSVE
ncbi:DUF6946 family protein [Bremerella cremea]|uniref:DUF6946 family protein n=1 Tax=Bremerella cremea TaxID=1031537 RepID=UPI0031E50CD2